MSPRIFNLAQSTVVYQIWNKTDKNQNTERRAAKFFQRSIGMHGSPLSCSRNESVIGSADFMMMNLLTSSLAHWIGHLFLPGEQISREAL